MMMFMHCLQKRKNDAWETRQQRGKGGKRKRDLVVFTEGKVEGGQAVGCAWPASFGFDVGPAAAGINLSRGGGKRKKNFFVFVDGKREEKGREKKDVCFLIEEEENLKLW